MTLGADQWRQIGLDGLSLNTVAVDPSNSQLILAGPGPDSAIGLWKSADGGATWTLITNGLPDPLRVNTIAFQPSGLNAHAVSVGGDDVEGLRPRSPASGHKVVAGTKGESGILIGTFNEIGLYRSADQGESWQISNSGMERPAFNITSIVFDTADPHVAYASHNDDPGGVSKSVDGGSTWFDASNGLVFDGICPSGCALDLAIDPSSPSTLYAAMPPLEDLYKTTSGGDVWFPTGIGFSAERIAQAPAVPGMVFASGSLGGISRTLDGGALWVDLSQQSGLPPSSSSYRSVVVDPLDSNTVWLVIQDFGATPLNDEAVYRSDDAGLSWTRANEGLDEDDQVFKIYDLAYQGHALLAATDNGIYRRIVELFSDGFESGDTSAWSEGTP